MTNHAERIRAAIKRFNEGYAQLSKDMDARAAKRKAAVQPVATSKPKSTTKSKPKPSVVRQKVTITPSGGAVAAEKPKREPYRIPDAVKRPTGVKWSDPELDKLRRNAPKAGQMGYSSDKGQTLQKAPSFGERNRAALKRSYEQEHENIKKGLPYVGAAGLAAGAGLAASPYAGAILAAHGNALAKGARAAAGGRKAATLLRAAHKKIYY